MGADVKSSALYGGNYGKSFRDRVSVPMKMKMKKQQPFSFLYHLFTTHFTPSLLGNEAPNSSPRRLYFGTETPGGVQMRMRSAHVTGTSFGLLTGNRRVNTELRGFGRTVS